MNRLRAAWAVLCGQPVAYRLLFSSQARVAWRSKGLAVDCSWPVGGLDQRRVVLPGGKVLLVVEPLGEHAAKVREQAERDARWNDEIDAQLARDPYGRLMKAWRAEAQPKGGVA